MSLVGNLEDLALTDILQIVSLSRKSGILGLSRPDAAAKIFFRNGLVVAARVSDFPLDLGAFLSRKGLLTTADQVQVRDRVRNGEDLSAILVNEFGVSEKVIEGFAKAGIEKVVYRLFTWKEGAFHFDLTEADNSAFESDPFMPYFPTGVNPQFLAMEGARLKDESDYFLASGGKEKPADAPLSKQQPASKPAIVPPRATAAPSQAPVPPVVTTAPAASPLATAPRPVAPPREAGGVAQPLLLVIDNDAVAIKNIEVALQARGFEVASFTRVEAGVKAARELLRKGRSLVVLADLVMPKRDGSGMLGGLEVLELLRAEEQHVPVALLADLQNPEAEAKARELQADGYLSKPGRKHFVKDADNTFAEFTGFIQSVVELAGKLAPRAARISASKIADPFVDLGVELHGELEAAASHVSANAPMGGGGTAEKSRGLNLLKEMVRELNDPHFNADVSLLVLRFAVELMSRAVIFVIAGNEAIGLGQAGVEKSDATIAVKKMRIPLTDSSIFADVMASKAPVRRRLDSSKWNLHLLETLGGAEPTESFAAPIFTAKRIAAIVYGDNAGEDKALGDLDSFEIFLSHAGIAMERSLLERRLRDLTSGRRVNYPD